jgi:hypothetical protein
MTSAKSTQRDRVDVHEDLVLAEAGREPVVQAAGHAAGLLPPVADEHPARAGSRHRGQTLPWRTAAS